MNKIQRHTRKIILLWVIGVLLGTIIGGLLTSRAALITISTEARSPSPRIEFRPDFMGITLLFILPICIFYNFIFSLLIGAIGLIITLYFHPRTGDDLLYCLPVVFAILGGLVGGVVALAIYDIL